MRSPSPSRSDDSHSSGSPASGAEAEADAGATAIVTVAAIVVAGPAIITVAPANHVAIIAAVVALDIARAAGPIATAILVTDETDLLGGDEPS